MPAVSVIIPSYNSARYLPQAIESVQAQTYQDLEIIVVDDGSTDDTAALVRQIGASDRRVRYVYQANKGLAGARNTGVRAAEGRYLAFLDADDLFLPGKLEGQVRILEESDDMGLVAGGHYFVDARGRVLYEAHPWRNFPRLEFETFLLGIPFIVPDVLVRHEWIERLEGFDEQFRRLEDWDMWLRLAHAGCPMTWGKEVVSCYRMHRNQMVRDAIAQKRGMLTVLDKFYASPDIPPIAQARRDQAYASVYIRGACREYGAGDVEEARRDLARAIELEPELAAGQRERLFQTLVGWVAEPVVGDPFRYLKNVFDNLPEEAAFLKAERRRAMALGAMTLFFNAYQRRDWQTIRRVLPIAVRYDPRWLANRGVLSIAAQAYLKFRHHPRPRSIPVTSLQKGHLTAEIAEYAKHV